MKRADQSQFGFETVGSGMGYTLRRAASQASRALLHRFIQKQFKHHFQAQVPDDAAELLGVFDEAEDLVAAFGIRSAAEGLFSQCYLEEEALDILSREVRGTVQPTEVVELSHLSLAGPRTFCRLVPLVADMLWEAGYRYVICTATSCLVRYFTRSKFAPTVLAEASRTRLPEGRRDCWGSYYDSKPAVVYGALEQARNVLADAMPASRAAASP